MPTDRLLWETTPDGSHPQAEREFHRTADGELLATFTCMRCSYSALVKVKSHAFDRELGPQAWRPA